MTDLEVKVKFPEEFTRVKAGLLLPDKRTAITGHLNGLVVESDIRSGNCKILDDCHFEINTITCSPNQEILVGCQNGLIYIFPLKNPLEKMVIQEPGFSKFSRVWRVVWSDVDTFFMSSNYGVLMAFKRGEGLTWSSTPLPGHSPNAIFGIGVSSEGLLVSGDYHGNIVVRDTKKTDYQVLDQSKIQSGVQGVAWYSKNSFAVIDGGGRIHVFESAEEESQWKQVFETDTATSRGESVIFTSDGRSIYAGTKTELIQFDLETQQTLQTPADDIRAIFSDDSNAYFITAEGVSSVPRKKIIIPTNVVSYQYAKISLIGHTGVGKSTLCSNLVSGKADGIESTFGKLIWIKEMETEEGAPHRRLILHDHGGQETVLGTFIPFLTDSDIILVFFKQTDNDTFESALRILDELSEIISKATKVFLVKTFIDQTEMADYNPETIKHLIFSKRIVDCLEVEARNAASVEQISKQIMDEISWESAKTMIESQYVEGIMRTIPSLQDSGATVVPVDEVKSRFEDLVNIPIPKPHLKFLLKNLSSQGIIEYYPEKMKSDSVIINDNRYNLLRTKIPIYVRNKHGLARIEEMQKEFSPTEYVDILDEIYQDYGISVRNDGLRIFPAQLSDRNITVNEPYKSLLGSAKPQYSDRPPQKLRIGRLFDALSELKMSCITASQISGLFAWETNACIYFLLEKSTNAISGDSIKVTYYIGGDRPDICDRLHREFSTLMDRFYGNEIEISNTTKKKELKKYKYDVAISFAGEQRGYAEKLADQIRKSGLAVFYDGYQQDTIWGKDQSVFFQEVYYKESRWCIMLISKDYVTKKWPAFEAKNAIARQIDQFGDYILPVKFDETVVVGLPPQIAYQDGTKMTPEQIATLFLKKFQGEP